MVGKPEEDEGIGSTDLIGSVGESNDEDLVKRIVPEEPHDGERVEEAREVGERETDVGEPVCGRTSEGGMS